MARRRGLEGNVPLERQRERQLARGLRTRIPPDEDFRDNLLFTSPEGFPLSRTRFRNRVWQPATKLAKIAPQPNFHDLRHSYAAWLIANGEHVKTIQDRLGHTSIRTSMDLYGHLMTSLDGAQVDRMNAALSGRRGT